MKFGITQDFECSYIKGQQERLLICMEPIDTLKGHYKQLIQAGFRRSGVQLYKPHCGECDSCQSIRVLCNRFTPSKSQKRLLNKNKDIVVKWIEEERDDYYPLYEQYINECHRDGSMYPPSYDQYRCFFDCIWQRPTYIEGRIDGKLVGVAVCDKVDDGLSALYTFFDPSLRSRSLGSYFILQQIKSCYEQNLPHLYLGYQIDECKKMNYKSKFTPHERFKEGQWKLNSN